MRPTGFYIVNAITSFRLLLSPVLVILVLYDGLHIFKWLLAVGFFTDMLDGFLARRLKVQTKFGAKLDSIADDALLIASAFAVMIEKPDFIYENYVLIMMMVILLIIQNGLAYWRYGRMSSYHTYFAKLAMFLQGCFLILLFFLPEVPYWLFYPAAIVTLLDLSEEIVLVFILPKWKTNVKGLYWVLKGKTVSR